MPVAPVPAEFATVGQRVVIIGRSGNGVTNAKVTKVTKTQVTVETPNGSTRRFYDDGRNRRDEMISLGEVGGGSTYVSAPRLHLTNDPRVNAAARYTAKLRRDRELRAAAEEFGKKKTFTPEDIATMRNALNTFEAAATAAEQEAPAE